MVKILHNSKLEGKNVLHSVITNFKISVFISPQDETQIPNHKAESHPEENTKDDIHEQEETIASCEQTPEASRGNQTMAGRYSTFHTFSLVLPLNFSTHTFAFPRAPSGRMSLERKERGHVPTQLDPQGLSWLGNLLLLSLSPSHLNLNTYTTSFFY